MKLFILLVTVGVSKIYLLLDKNLNVSFIAISEIYSHLEIYKCQLFKEKFTDKNLMVSLDEITLLSSCSIYIC